MPCHAECQASQDLTYEYSKRLTVKIADLQLSVDIFRGRLRLAVTAYSNLIDLLPIL
jgi:hypothetical protein